MALSYLAKPQAASETAGTARQRNLAGSQLKEPPAHQVGDGAGFHFLHDLAAMDVERLGTDAQLDGNVLVLLAGHHQVEDFLFAARQAIDAFDDGRLFLAALLHLVESGERGANAL